MIEQLLRDPFTYIGTIGATLMMSVEWIATNVNPMLAMFGGVGGLVMLVLTIIEKIKKNRMLDAEYEEYKRTHNK